MPNALHVCTEDYARPGLSLPVVTLVVIVRPNHHHCQQRQPQRDGPSCPMLLLVGWFMHSCFDKSEEYGGMTVNMCHVHHGGIANSTQEQRTAWLGRRLQAERSLWTTRTTMVRFVISMSVCLSVCLSDQPQPQPQPQQKRKSTKIPQPPEHHGSYQGDSYRWRRHNLSQAG